MINHSVPTRHVDFRGSDICLAGVFDTERKLSQSGTLAHPGYTGLIRLDFSLADFRS